MKRIFAFASLIVSFSLAGVAVWIALVPAARLALSGRPPPLSVSAPAPAPALVASTAKKPTPEQLARLAPAADFSRTLLERLGSDPSWTHLDFTAHGHLGFERVAQWAAVDWPQNRCLARVDPDLAFGGPNPDLGARLAVASATAGCALRARPHLGWRDAGYKGTAPEGLLDELWATDTAMMGEGQRYNWFRMGANGYAEAAAAGLALLEGVPAHSILRVFDEAESASFAGEQAGEPSRSTAWMLSGVWRSKGWTLDRAARAAGARRALGFSGFTLLATLPPREIAQIVASSWCQWQLSAEASEVAFQGANTLLGRIHSDKARRVATAAEHTRMTGRSASALAQPSSKDWGTPFPDMVMPRVAVHKLQWESSPRMRLGETLRDTSDADERTCLDSGVGLLAARYGPQTLALR